MLEKSEIRFLPLGARRVAYEIRGDGPPLVAPAWRRICLNRAPYAKFSCVSANSGESAAGRMKNFISEPVVACVAAMLAMPKHCHFQE